MIIVVFFFFLNLGREKQIRTTHIQYIPQKYNYILYNNNDRSYLMAADFETSRGSDQRSLKKIYIFDKLH